MIMSAQLSLYPLRQEHLSPAIQAVNEALRAAGLQPQVGAMSTLVTGDAATHMCGGAHGVCAGGRQGPGGGGLASSVKPHM
jgi:hypothetical protein